MSEHKTPGERLFERGFGRSITSKTGRLKTSESSSTSCTKRSFTFSISFKSSVELREKRDS